MDTKLFDKIKAKKDSTLYGVKNIAHKAIDIDMTKRNVEGIFNTYFYIDYDLDMLVTGAAKRSIQHSGPDSNAVAKIKHLSDHMQRTESIVGKLDELEEKEVDGLMRIKFVSNIPETTKGNDHLINYQKGIYDQHSIGFRYLSYVVCARDSENEDYVKNWDEWYPQAINKEVADDTGFFFVVKEIELWEGSVVVFGANDLTGTIGVKSKDKNVQLVELNERLSILTESLRKGTQSDDMMKMLELQEKQIKQMMIDIINLEPTTKGTPQKDPPKPATLDFNKIIDEINLNIN